MPGLSTPRFPAPGRSARLLTAALLVLVTCGRALLAQADARIERDRKAAADTLRRIMSQAKFAEERAALAKQLAWVEGDGWLREQERIRNAMLGAGRKALSQAKTPEERARLERQLARIERGEPAFDKEESLEIAGYEVTKPRTTPSVYGNATHGYQVTLPAGIELQEHRNGNYVIVEPHGCLFGIWIHAEAGTADVEARLLLNFERWCGEHPESARERARNGGSLRLVPIQRGPFAGYKAVAKDLPDAAPARFYAFKSPRQDGYFGFNLTPKLAGELFESLQPLGAAKLR